MMSQIVNLALEELPLGWLELQMVLSEALQHNALGTHMLFLHLRRTIGFPCLKWCTALKPCPLLSAKNQPSDPGRRNILCQLNSQWLLVSWGAGRSLSWFLHSVWGSQCKTTDLHLSRTLTQLHYTMTLAWMNSACFQHFPSCMHEPHPL